jgi:hypothetical protein
VLNRKRSKPEARLCWVASPASKTLRQCSLFQLTEQAATIGSIGALPDTFELFLSLEQEKGHRCRVVSRDGAEVSVEFLGSLQRLAP